MPRRRVNLKKYEVQVLDVNVPGWGWTVHLKVRRSDGKGGITWDELQAIKDEFAGPEAAAVEVYPAASDLVNEANIRHLWVVPEGIPIPNIRKRDLP